MLGDHRKPKVFFETFQFHPSKDNFSEQTSAPKGVYPEQTSAPNGIYTEQTSAPKPVYLEQISFESLQLNENNYISKTLRLVYHYIGR